MLTVDSIIPFLLERGLIDPAWIVAGDLMIGDAARRNRNIWVKGPEGTGFFLKQPDAWGHGSRAMLRREARFYRLCAELSAVSEMLGFLPRILLDDFDSGTLVLELIADSVSIKTLMQEQPDPATTVAAATQAIGHALGTAHRVFGAAYQGDDQRFSKFTRNLPWVLSFHKPSPEILTDLSAANLETIRILQAEQSMFDRLEALQSQWEAKTVIHGDVKFDHFLIDPSSVISSHESPPIWIVDWETVSIGDPAWDLAGALHEFLVAWVSAMPISQDTSAEQMLERSTLPLADLRNWARSLWSGYRTGANLGPADADRILLRAVKYSAARMIQTAFELSQEADRLSGRAVMLLQLSANLLSEPELAQMQLYGISVGSLAS